MRSDAASVFAAAAAALLSAPALAGGDYAYTMDGQPVVIESVYESEPAIMTQEEVMIIQDGAIVTEGAYGETIEYMLEPTDYLIEPAEQDDFDQSVDESGVLYEYVVEDVVEYPDGETDVLYEYTSELIYAPVDVEIEAPVAAPTTY